MPTAPCSLIHDFAAGHFEKLWHWLDRPAPVPGGAPVSLRLATTVLDLKMPDFNEPSLADVRAFGCVCELCEVL